jgi:spore coat protein U-like protein
LLKKIKTWLYYWLDFSVNKPIEEACAGRTIQMKCDLTSNTNYTIAIDDSFYGVKGAPSTGCSFA